MSRIGIVLISVALFGCGKSSTTVPVSGIVKLDGKPLANASVSFVPEGQGKQATGTTDEFGKFVLSTIDPRDGAMPGHYKVIISPNSAPIEAPEGQSADEGMVSDAAAAKSKKQTVPKFPQAYTRIDETPLVEKVPADSEIVYDLSSK
jgi:hypothetical protein